MLRLVCVRDRGIGMLGSAGLRRIRLDLDVDLRAVAFDVIEGSDPSRRVVVRFRRLGIRRNRLLVIIRIRLCESVRRREGHDGAARLPVLG